MLNQSNAIPQVEGGGGGEHIDLIPVSLDLGRQSCNDAPWSIYRSYYQNSTGLPMEKARVQHKNSIVSSTGAECGSDIYFEKSEG
jgi:hypothetical protein